MENLEQSFSREFIKSIYRQDKKVDATVFLDEVYEGLHKNIDSNFMQSLDETVKKVQNLVKELKPNENEEKNIDLKKYLEKSKQLDSAITTVLNIIEGALKNRMDEINSQNEEGRINSIGVNQSGFLLNSHKKDGIDAPSQPIEYIFKKNDKPEKYQILSELSSFLREYILGEAVEIRDTIYKTLETQKREKAELKEENEIIKRAEGLKKYFD